jgi:hypothetical protein
MKLLHDNIHIIKAPHIKFFCCKGSRTWIDCLDKRPKLKNMDMRFGKWNVRSLHMAGSLMTVVKEI